VVVVISVVEVDTSEDDSSVEVDSRVEVGSRVEVDSSVELGASIVDELALDPSSSALTAN